MSTYKQKTTLKNNTWPTQTPYKPKVISGAPEGLAYPALHAAFVVLSQAGHCKIWYKVKSGMRTGHLITSKVLELFLHLSWKGSKDLSQFSLVIKQ
jgi:hypothetical protein